MEQLDPKLYSIEFEKLTNEYNSSNQLLNLELKDKKWNKKFTEENSDLIIIFRFIIPVRQVDEIKPEFYTNDDNLIPIFTSKEKYDSWRKKY